jgi:hypothetical protein
MVDNDLSVMARLTVHPQEGFDGDRVVLHAEGQVLAVAEDVTTLRLFGAAEAKLTATVSDGPVSLRIEVPTRGLETERRLGVRGDMHFLVAIRDGVLFFDVADEEPGYM